MVNLLYQKTVVLIYEDIFYEDTFNIGTTVESRIILHPDLISILHFYLIICSPALLRPYPLGKSTLSGSTSSPASAASFLR